MSFNREALMGFEPMASALVSCSTPFAQIAITGAMIIIFI